VCPYYNLDEKFWQMRDGLLEEERNKEGGANVVRFEYWAV
jgi:hypothetical protein